MVRPLTSVIKHVVRLGLAACLSLMVWTGTGLAATPDTSPPEECLSCNEDRLSPMMQDCQSRLGLSKAACECLFSQALDTSLSNADLSFYFADQREKLSSEKLSIADSLKTRCDAPHLSTSKPGKEPPGGGEKSAFKARHWQACLNSNVLESKAQCDCFLSQAEEAGLSDRLVSLYLSGKHTKVMDASFKTHSKLSKLAWTCGTIKEGYHWRNGKATTGVIRGVHGPCKIEESLYGLCPRPNARPYSGHLFEQWLKDNPNLADHHTEVVDRCLADKAWPYMTFGELNGMAGEVSLVIGSMPDPDAYNYFYLNIKRDCYQITKAPDNLYARQMREAHAREAAQRQQQRNATVKNLLGEEADKKLNEWASQVNSKLNRWLD